MNYPMCQSCWRYPVLEGEALCPACSANHEIRGQRNEIPL